MGVCGCVGVGRCGWMWVSVGVRVCQSEFFNV